ncbi:MAG: YceI family protein [Flavobacteriaceae bacterium]|nr:YceI family protein [Flavobacteriaceae bacterium]
MKKLALLAVLASGMLTAQVRKVSQSEIQWWGYKVMKTEASSHYGTLDLKEGQIEVKNGAILGGTFVLDMKSINTTDLEGKRKESLDNHLKGEDFFAVEKYPTATYKITSVKMNPKNKPFNANIEGELTLKGKTAKVSFPANVVVNKNGVSLQSDKFSFDRQVFGVAFKATMKDVVIKDEIDLTVSLKAQ